MTYLPETPTLRDMETLNDMVAHDAILAEIWLSPCSAAANALVEQLPLPADCALIAVMRGDRMIFPHAHTPLLPGDRIIAALDRHAEPALREALTRLAPPCSPARLGDRVPGGL